MRFRILIGLLFGLVLLYVGYWFVLANKAEEKLLSQIAAERMRGAAIAYDELNVRGFPYRLEFAATNLDVSRDEANGVSWRLQSPEVIVVLQPWKLTHAIAFSRNLDLTLSEKDGAPSEIAVTDFKASVVTGKDFAPMRLAAEAKTLQAIGPDLGGAPVSVSDPAFHWRKPDQGEVAVAARPDLDNGPLEPMQSEWAIRGVNLTHRALGESPYGDVIEHFDMTLAVHGGLEANLDRGALIAWRDEGGTLELHRLSVNWGRLDLLLSGSVSLDEKMRPLGAFTAEVRGYEPVIDELQQTGQIDASEAETVKSTLSTLAEKDQSGRLTIPIAMQSGRLFVGPLPVANLPPILDQDPGVE
jgi:hypothetical protein